MFVTGCIHWYNGAAPAEWATTPEELIEKAGWPDYISREEALRFARSAIAKNHRRWRERVQYDDVPITWH